MFRTLQELTPRDPHLPDRTWRLSVLQRVLAGTLYDVLPYEFHQERNAAGEYIPLSMRAPSVRYGLCGCVVDNSVALLFSEGHFPKIDAGSDKGLRQVLREIVSAAKLNAVMIDAARRGSIGSVCLRLRVLKRRPFVDALDTVFLTPVWRDDAPDELLRVVELRKASGASLAAAGYDVADGMAGVDFWFRREWDGESETWFLPSPVSDGAADAMVVDAKRTVRHGLGFVPLVWVRNLPGGDEVDGCCTFRAAIETGIEIDYQLSQAGRGLKYSSDPTLLIKEPAGMDSQLVRGAANALVLSERGDAKLLEIGGTASQAVLDYVRVLREFALETVHGNPMRADRVGAPQSGRAMQMMNQGLIWLADNMRASYGDGLLSIVRMVLRAAAVTPVEVNGAVVSGSEHPSLSLKWPGWYPLDPAEKQAEAAALSLLRNAGHISRDSAVQSVAAQYDIDDLEGELAAIARDRAEAADEARIDGAVEQVRTVGEG